MAPVALEISGLTSIDSTSGCDVAIRPSATSVRAIPP
jgi:hypothetical protein